MSENKLVLDALIVGGGFGGCYQLKHLREEGYNVKLVDMASDYAGVWYWNRYPGARVDSAVPHYEYSDPDLWRDWRWKQRFPDSGEIRDYFAYVAEKWNLRKDTIFDTCITRAVWNEETKRWLVESKLGMKFDVQFLLLNTGIAAKRYMPDWKGIDSFGGTWIHPSYWPAEEPDLKGKRTAVIGTGSTGVQLAQNLSQIAGELVVFQRTPNLAIPMEQENFTDTCHSISAERYKQVFDGRHSSFGGFDFNFCPRLTFEDSPEERHELYEKLWEKGDFHFWLANYQDMLYREDANSEAYNFWRSKVECRVKDPRAREILAPKKQPYSFGCKRISLENGFYEIFNQPNVYLVDVNKTPIVEVTKSGIKTTEKEWHFDYVVCATGFDAVTGGLVQIDITGTSGQKLADKWKSGVKTYLGMAVAGFPNMFFTYGPQAPTAFCNGPTCAEAQGGFLIRVLNDLSKRKLKRIEAEKDAEVEWGQDVRNFASQSLLPGTKSWYMGDNIPGKPRECLVYLGGVPTYIKTLASCVEGGFTGFQCV